MPDLSPENLLIVLHRAPDGLALPRIEASFAERHRVEAMLFELLDRGEYVSEFGNVWSITAAGKGRLDELREAREREAQAQRAAKPQQKAMFQ